jgi:hypothetical protein
MNHKLRKNLEPTRDLLAGSLQLHASEQAPALPGDLLDDLASRFSTTPATAAPVRQRSWLAKVQSFIARPAFGMAALALVILGISVPRMIDSTRPTGGFRGSISPTAEAHNIRIILIQSPAGFQQALANVGDFESSMISSATSSDSITGPRILVDFATSTITALNASDEQIHTAPLPKDAEEISAAIATAVSRL